MEGNMQNGLRILFIATCAIACTSMSFAEVIEVTVSYIFKGRRL